MVCLSGIAPSQTLKLKITTATASTTAAASTAAATTVEPTAVPRDSKFESGSARRSQPWWCDVT